MFCNNCNHKLPDGSKFCQYCGKKLEKAVAVPNETRAEELQENPKPDFPTTTTFPPVTTEVNKVICKPAETIKIVTDKNNSPQSINTKSKKKVIAVIASLVVLLTLIFSINYLTAHQKAENVVAISLSKENNDNQYYDDFTSFQRTYYTVKFANFKYVVELSGSAYMGLSSKVTSFYAEVEINSLTGNAVIRELVFNGMEIK